MPLTDKTSSGVESGTMTSKLTKHNLYFFILYNAFLILTLV